MQKKCRYLQVSFEFINFIHMNMIALFCSASDSIAPIYKENAEALGAWLGAHHKWLIYGGANTRLREVVAEAAKANGD